MLNKNWFDEKTNRQLAVVYMTTRILLVGVAALLWLPVVMFVPHTLTLSRDSTIIFAVLFIMMLSLFCSIFDCFGIGQARIRELTVWYGLATLFANLSMWLIVIVSTGESTPLLFNALTWITQSLVGMGLIVLLNRTYYGIYPKRHICAIVGGYDFEKRALAKMAEYSHRFVIEKVIRQDQITVDDVESLAPECNALVIGDVNADLSKAILADSYAKGRVTLVIPTAIDVIFNGYKIKQINDELLFFQNNVGLSLEQRFVKRAIDIIGSIIGIVLSIIPIAICALIIKRTDGGPVFYRQDRLTRNGKVFGLIKLRSMRIDSEKEGIRFAAKNDERITPIGRVIRKIRLDEAPQFFNVFRGDMSLCGPRAERPEIAELCCKELPTFAFRLKVKAGIAWDIIAPKPEVGKKVSGTRILPAYEGSRTVRAVAA